MIYSLEHMISHILRMGGCYCYIYLGSIMYIIAEHIYTRATKSVCLDTQHLGKASVRSRRIHVEYTVVRSLKRTLRLSLESKQQCTARS